jgi:hypothetical protein
MVEGQKVRSLWCPCESLLSDMLLTSSDFGLRILKQSVLKSSKEIQVFAVIVMIDFRWVCR